MAGAGGFEPPNAGIKTPCLAAWRRPKKNCYDDLPVAGRLLARHEAQSLVDRRVLHSAGDKAGVMTGELAKYCAGLLLFIVATEYTATSAG